MRRRGFGLVIALTTITLVGATVSLVTLCAVRMAVQRRHERARCYAQTVLESGVAYVRSHREQLRVSPPAQELVLPADGLLDASAKGRLMLLSNGKSAITVRATVEIGNARASEEATVPTAD